jgi:hypothetical protein
MIPNGMEQKKTREVDWLKGMPMNRSDMTCSTPERRKTKKMLVYRSSNDGLGRAKRSRAR